MLKKYRILYYYYNSTHFHKVRRNKRECETTNFVFATYFI